MSHKQELITEALNVLLNNVYDNKRTIAQLLKEALEKKTIRELEEIID